MSTRTTTETGPKDDGSPKLVFRTGPCRGRVLILNRDRITLGRDEDNDVVIEHDIVSSHHAILIREGRKFRLEDLRSKNGTFVNGERVTSAELSEGDVIWFCQNGQEIEFTFGEPSLPSLLATSTATYQRTGSIESAVRELLPQRGSRNVSSTTGVRQFVAGTLEVTSRRQRRTVVVVGGVVASILVAGFVTLAVLLSGGRPDGVASTASSNVSANVGNHAASRRPHVHIDVDVQPIFSSLFHSYRGNGIGEIRLENRGKNEVASLHLEVDLSGNGTRLLAESMRFEIPELAAAGTWSATLRPVLTGDIVTDRSLDATLVARLTRDGEEISVVDRAITVHDYHAFSWERPERVSVFIDSNDLAVRALADAAWALRPESTSRGFPPVNVERAITLLSALAARGVRYKPDAETPVSVSPQWKARDRVNYPGETLLRGTGDCDDLVVLCCSLLETAGVPSAVVVGDDHVLLMFDSGLPAPGAEAGGAQSENGEPRASSLFARGTFVARKGRLWLPIESTELARKGGSFASAWGAARSRVEAIHAGRMTVVEVREAWTKFKPLHPAPSEDVRRRIRDQSTWKLPGLETKILSALKSLRDHGRNNVESGLKSLESEYEGAELAQAKAFLYAGGGLFEDAAAVLESELFGSERPATTDDVRKVATRRWEWEISFDVAVLLADLALQLTLASSENEDLDRAAAYLDVAIASFPDDLPEKSEMMLRLGMIHLVRGRLGPHQTWTDRAVERNPDLKDRLAALLASTGTVASRGRSEKVHHFLRDRIRRLTAGGSR